MIVLDHQSDMDNHSDQLNPNNDEYNGDQDSTKQEYSK